jgi:hypothetical protein
MSRFVKDRWKELVASETARGDQSEETTENETESKDSYLKSTRILLHRYRYWCLAASLSILAVCLVAVYGRDAGSGPKLGKVSGTVKLDGDPLPDATIEFQPMAAEGSPSTAVTGSDGSYELMFLAGKPGAMVGKHIVRITTYRQLSSEDPRGPGEIPEKLPPQYNSESTLEKEVKSGRNTIDFELLQ